MAQAWGGVGQPPWLLSIRHQGRIQPLLDALAHLLLIPREPVVRREAFRHPQAMLLSCFPAGEGVIALGGDMVQRGQLSQV